MTKNGYDSGLWAENRAWTRLPDILSFSLSISLLNDLCYNSLQKKHNNTLRLYVHMHNVAIMDSNSTFAAT